MANTDTLVELDNVSRQYESYPEPTRVLNGVNMRVATGDTVAVVGPSGCGKSTLLNILGTLDRPTDGSVRFDGRDLADLTETETALFRNRHIGFVFQLHHLLPQCTVLENVLVPTLVNRDSHGARDRAVDLLKRVGLGDRMDRKPGLLSGGERQRTAVVRALINQPRLLLADEPTGSLSRQGANELTHLILELNREENMTLIVVTHSVEVAEMMDSVFELRDGHLVKGSSDS
ncbi:MAG: ABC transporter ATP-binding protein [Candidatus Hydrogenedentes bacterium]|nr:ABC transporter ATP-binding protein [Candidatus Hydrogenedentota bacterium]